MDLHELILKIREIANLFKPEELYTKDQLKKWAEENGYVKNENVVTLNKERAEELKKALKEEYKNLPTYNVYGESNHKEQYALVYEYLETGIVPKYIDENHTLLRDVIMDFDDICITYGV